MHVFDATVTPPKQTVSVALRDQPGWVTFSLDGRYAYPSTGEVIDTKTKKVFATLKDEKGRPVHSEKMVEIHFKDGMPVKAGDQFGVGRVLPVKERRAASRRLVGRHWIPFRAARLRKERRQRRRSPCPPKSVSSISPVYLVDRDALAFRALADGKPLSCIVSAELLHSDFKAKDMTEEEMRRSYQEHKAEIQAIAKEHIHNGWMDDLGRVFLTNSLHEITGNVRPQPLCMVRRAFGGKKVHKVLLDLIGPNAEEVVVQWSTKTDDRGQPVVSVLLTDPTTKLSVASRFAVPLPPDPNVQRLWFARLWSQFLQLRSHELILKSR